MVPDNFKECFMLKKYMIFGSVVLLLAALLTMTGCSQATDSDGGTTVSNANYLYGDANEEDVIIAVRAARYGNRTVVLGQNLRLRGNSWTTAVADFEDMTVRVEHNVRVTNMIINAAYANFTFAEGASITLWDNAAFIYSGIPDEKNIVLTPNSRGKVKLVDEPLLGTQGTDTGIAVEDYQIGPNFNDIHRDVTHLYVLKTLKIDERSTATTIPGSPRIIPLGTVDLGASYTLPVGWDLFEFTSSATLTSTVPGVILTVPTEPGTTNWTRVDLPTIDAAVPLNITATVDLPELNIAALNGPGTLTIRPATGEDIVSFGIGDVSESGNVVVSAAHIGGVGIGSNAGSINLTATSAMGGIKINGNTGSGTIALNVSGISSPVTVDKNEGAIEFDTSITAAIINIANNTKTGEVIFKRDLTISPAYGLSAPSNEGKILFQGNVNAGVLGNAGTLPPERAQNIAGIEGTVEFTGRAFFGDVTNIDCDTVFNAGFTVSGAHALSLGGDVTLANGQSVALTGGQTTLKGGKRILVGAVPVLAGGAAGVTISSSGTTFTAGVPTDLEDSADPGFKTLIANSAITVVGGELRVLGTGLLRNSETSANNAIIVGPAGTLTLEEGGILELPASNTVVLGTTTINGVNDGSSPPLPAQITASGGEVVLKQNNISGKGAALQIPLDYTVAPTFAVNSGILYLAGVNLDLITSGALALNTNSVVLESGTYPGKITLGEDTTPYTGALGGKRIVTGANPINLIGNGALLGDDDAIPCLIGQLSGTLRAPLTLTGTGSASTLVTGLSVVD
jgi:hypothetical protein